MGWLKGHGIDGRGQASRGSAWMEGITPGRLAIVALVCILSHAVNPSTLADHFWMRVGRSLHNASIHFISSLPMLVLVVRADLWTARDSDRRRITMLALAVIAGACLWPLERWALRIGILPLIGTPGSFWEYSLGQFFSALAMGGLLTAVLYFAAREREAQRRLHQTRLARTEIDRQMAEARLQLLQAQIEPHFLFNSLASVKRLYETDAEQGRSMLRNLGDYLRVAISRTGLREARLGEEVALARAFLAICEVRMGQRLRVRIDVPAELEGGLLPPLMVGTLVENAIKHGIGPRASGGCLSLTARRNGGDLEVEVADDGVGFRARSGRGVGLSNIRARLETLFAAGGSLELASAQAGGVTATLRLPFSSAAEREAR
jgi:signal transduction histidine kinase